jgi:hypothetical protein
LHFFQVLLEEIRVNLVKKFRAIGLSQALLPRSARVAIKLTLTILVPKARGRRKRQNRPKKLGFLLGTTPPRRGQNSVN